MPLICSDAGVNKCNNNTITITFARSAACTAPYLRRNATRLNILSTGDDDEADDDDDDDDDTEEEAEEEAETSVSCLTTCSMSCHCFSNSSHKSCGCASFMFASVATLNCIVSLYERTEKNVGSAEGEKNIRRRRGWPRKKHGEDGPITFVNMHVNFENRLDISQTKSEGGRIFAAKSFSTTTIAGTGENFSRSIDSAHFK